MSTSSLGHSFRVSEARVHKLFDIRFNIQKRREQIIFKTSTIQDNINLAYTISEETNSDNNLSVLDRSTALVANHIPNIIPIDTFTAISYQTVTDKFQLTDVFVTTFGSKLQTPLFYKHILNNFDSTDTNLRLINLDILDHDFNIISLSELSIDYENGIVYSNIKNTFDEVYYVRYTIKNLSTNKPLSYTEIINNINVYSLATFDDINEYGALISTNKAYLLDEIAANSYEITLANYRNYAIRDQSNSRIKILPPGLTTVDDPWFVTVTNGNFFATLNISTLVTSTFKYNIPEFTNQSFTPFAPFKLVTGEASTIVNNRLLQVLKQNVYLDTDENLDILVVLRDPDTLIARKVFSTDTDLIDTWYETTTLITDNIRSIDKANGFIDITEDIQPTDIIEVTYYYEETEYKFIDIDFNPITNTNLFGNRIVLYVIPNTSNLEDQTLFYLIVDSSGLIINISQLDNSDLVADLATGNFYYDRVSPSSSMSDLSFIDKYTVQVLPSLQFANTSNPKYLVLGDIYISENSHPFRTENLDIRMAGGGIKKDQINTLIVDHPEIQYTYDVATWEGLSYPGNGAYYIELPASLQKEYGGDFNDIALRQMVERHTGFGIYPLIHTYNSINPVLEYVDVTDSTIEVSWRSFGAGKTYNLYYSTEEDGTFTLYNPTPIVDSSYGNNYTISDLESETTYWIYVIHVENEEEVPNNIIGIQSNLTYQLLNKLAIQTE